MARAPCGTADTDAKMAATATAKSRKPPSYRPADWPSTFPMHHRTTRTPSPRKLEAAPARRPAAAARPAARWREPRRPAGVRAGVSAVVQARRVRAGRGSAAISAADAAAPISATKPNVRRPAAGPAQHQERSAARPGRTAPRPRATTCAAAATARRSGRSSPGRRRRSASSPVEQGATAVDAQPARWAGRTGAQTTRRQQDGHRGQQPAGPAAPEAREADAAACRNSLSSRAGDQEAREHEENVDAQQAAAAASHARVVAHDAQHGERANPVERGDVRQPALAGAVAGVGASGGGKGRTRAPLPRRGARPLPRRAAAACPRAACPPRSGSHRGTGVS